MLRDLAAPGSNHGSRALFGKIVNVAELTDHSALIRVRVDSAKRLIDYQTHPVRASGKLVLQKRQSFQNVFWAKVKELFSHRLKLPTLAVSA